MYKLNALEEWKVKKKKILFRHELDFEYMTSTYIYRRSRQKRTAELRIYNKIL